MDVEGAEVGLVVVVQPEVGHVELLEVAHQEAEVVVGVEECLEDVAVSIFLDFWFIFVKDRYLLSLMTHHSV